MFELLPTTARLRDQRADLELDHGALAAAVAARTSVFADAGLGAGAFAVIGHGEGAGVLVDLFAAWQIGAVAVLASPTLTADERARVAAVTRAALWVGTAPPSGVRSLAPDLPQPEVSFVPELRAPDGAALDAPALVLMTSGTTAQPKGVVHSQRSLRARLALNLAHIEARDLERSLSLLPLHFGHGLIGNCLTPLMAGAHLTLWPEPGVAGLATLGSAIDERAITFLSSVPALWRIVLKTALPPARGSLRRVHVGSAPLSRDLWEAIGAWCGTRRILNMYGATEAANWIGGHSLEDGLAADGLVGRLWGGAARILGEDGTLGAAGEGEIAVATPALMTGYFDDPERTAAALKGGWFLTGDRGAIDAEGRLRLIGRRKHEINRAGIKIPAEEIDLLLERHPGVAEACAFPLDDPVAGEVVAAAVVPQRPGAVDAAGLCAWCEGRIRKEAQPARIFIVEALPRSERGKLDRERARALVLAPAHGTGRR